MRKFVIKMPGYREICAKRIEKSPVFWGNFSLPRPKEFATEAEADAYIEGFCFAVKYFDGEVKEKD